MLSNKWTIYIDEYLNEAILSVFKNEEKQVLGESHKDFNSAIQSLITPAPTQSTSESSGEVDNLRQALKDIALYNNGFVEYFRQHNYRLMYELWERVYAIATTYPFPSPSNQGSGQSYPRLVKGIKDIRDKLYDDLPTGSVSTFGLIKVIKSVIEGLDKILEETPSSIQEGRGKDVYTERNIRSME